MPTDPGSARSDAPDPRHAEAVDQLHRTCGVYTLPKVAGRILDQVGWRSASDLTKARLLEPAAGAGEFVLQAAIRLVKSYRDRGTEPRVRHLRSRITAFEIHSDAAREARYRVRDALQRIDVHHKTAAACSAAWIKNADFLLSKAPSTPYTHVVGNPPYLRWSKVPAQLRSLYEEILPAEMARGDLFLPFLDRSLELLSTGGRCGILCSDRWLYMAFGAHFRAKWLSRLTIASNEPLGAAGAFDRRVEAYPTILIATKRRAPQPRAPAVVLQSGETLEELGCTIKVGPALGHTLAFVLQPDEHDIEPELLHPWLDSSEILEGTVEWRGRRVIALFDNNGELAELDRFPRLESRLRRFAPKLRERSIVMKGGVWYRTIDRVRAADWRPPKLLVPGLARVPRVAIDRSGAVPSHGVYAIFPPPERVDVVYERLYAGRLASALNGVAPLLKRNYVRCYKHFLAQIRV